MVKQWTMLEIESGSFFEVTGQLELVVFLEFLDNYNFEKLDG